MRSPILVIGLALAFWSMSSCSSVEVFIEKKEVPILKPYQRFALVNKELGIQGFSDQDLDIMVQNELIQMLTSTGMQYDAVNPEVLIKYYSNEDIRQREKVVQLSPYPYWGMRMYDPWLFNPMMRNYSSTVRTSNYELLQVILDIIDPKADKYVMMITSVTEVSQPKNKPKLTIQALQKATSSFVIANAPN